MCFSNKYFNINMLIFTFKYKVMYNKHIFTYKLHISSTLYVSMCIYVSISISIHISIYCLLYI